MTRVGVISDTHGLLRPEAVEALRGSDFIVHAGDVGSADVLPVLRGLAPVTAARGNVDTGAWAHALPLTAELEVEGVSVLVYHGHLGFEANTRDYQAVVSGHSHRPGIETRADVLYLNPGSAGRKRFRLPVSLARLTIDGHKVTAELIYL